MTDMSGPEGPLKTTQMVRGTTCVCGGGDQLTRDRPYQSQSRILNGIRYVSCYDVHTCTIDACTDHL